MSDTPSDAQPKSKKVTIASLIPEKKRVATTAGPIFVRKATRKDWPELDRASSAGIGLDVIRLLASQAEDKTDHSGLADNVLENLDDTDLPSLADAIASHNNWGDLPEGAALVELGKKAEDALKVEAARQKDLLETMRKTIDSSYAFMDNSALAKLQKQMADMSSISRVEHYTSNLGFTGPLADPELSASQAAVLGRKEKYTPDLESNSIGRAAFENAQNSRLAAKKMESLAETVAELSQTIIGDVLPAWFRNVKQGQQDAKDTAVQAARSLSVTKWAVVASAVVAAAIGYWQVDVAKSLDKDSTLMQRQAELLLREQLQAQQLLINAQNENQKLLEQQISELQLTREQQRRQEQLLLKQLAGLEQALHQRSRSETALLKALQSNNTSSSQSH